MTGPCRELLALMAVMHMEDRGYVKVPRDQLADELGISPHRVTVLVGQATKAGLLVKVAGGHNGQVSKYAAQVVEGCPESATFRLGRYRAESTLPRHPSAGPEDGDGCSEKAPIRVRVSKTNPDNGTHPVHDRVSPDRGLTSLGIDTATTRRPTPIEARPSVTTTGTGRASA